MGKKVRKGEYDLLATSVYYYPYLSRYRHYKKYEPQVMKNIENNPSSNAFKMVKLVCDRVPRGLRDEDIIEICKLANFPLSAAATDRKYLVSYGPLFRVQCSEGIHNAAKALHTKPRDEYTYGGVAEKIYDSFKRLTMMVNHEHDPARSHRS